ncbi:phosphatase PAP2 family protein [bacterium]|nr:phosphatase PAP2 family protein [bacterium]
MRPFSKINRWLLIILFLTFSAPRLQAKETNSPDTIWSNSVQEFSALLSSPVYGSWEGYLLAAVFAGGVAVGLNNDLNWYHDVQNSHNDLQNKVMLPASLLGDGLFQVGGYALLSKFGNKQDQKIAAMAIEGQIVVGVISPLLKAVFSATRPNVDNTQRDWFTLQFSNNSFPSGHSMTVFCAAAILGDAYSIEWITYPLAALAAYSRIYNQRHWPADTIAGAGLGLLIGHTVLAFHQQQKTVAGVLFSVQPVQNGGQLCVSWHF